MSIEIKNAPYALKGKIVALCRETYEAHRAAAPQDWPENFFDLFIEPYVQAAFLDAKGRPVKVSPTLFIAEKDGEFAGYYRLSGVPTDPGRDYFSVELQDIYVVPQFRGQGIGAAFVAHAKGLAETHDWDILEATVADWNEGSRRLFEAQGFTVKSRKLAIGPERPARAVPAPKTPRRLSWLNWLWIVLTLFNAWVIVVLLSR